MKHIFFTLYVLLAGCANIPSPAERRDLADALASQQGWHAELLRADNFDLLAYLPPNQSKTDRLSIYIEGDGFAWISGSQPSTDPTPRDPLALKLALAQPEGTAVYLARPCQYVNAEATACSNRYWTEMRFAPEVIAATNWAIDSMKSRFGASQLTLVGYSGGGAVAALVAARRSDVVRLITVAGNLDHRAWTSYHRVLPLSGSINPADEINRLQGIRQWHFVGERDRNITPELIQGYVNRYSEQTRPTIQIVPGFDHHCCWAEQWPRLWRKATGI